MPLVTNDNKSFYDAPEGQIFANVGTGGHAVLDYLDKPYYVATQNRSYGFLETKIIDSDILNATFYTNDGTIADNFIINKTKQPHVGVSNASSMIGSSNLTSDAGCIIVNAVTMRLSPIEC